MPHNIDDRDRSRSLWRRWRRTLAMQATRLTWLTATENRKLAWVAILWTAGLTSIYSQALFTRAYATWPEQGIAAGLCFAAGALIGNIGRSLAVYLGAIVST